MILDTQQREGSLRRRRHVPSKTDDDLPAVRARLAGLVDSASAAASLKADDSAATGISPKKHCLNC